jgi:hypothetical protein
LGEVAETTKTQNQGQSLTSNEDTMSQTIIDGIIPRTPKGWRKLKQGCAVRAGDRQSDHEGGWTTLTREHARRGPVGKFEFIIRH